VLRNCTDPDILRRSTLSWWRSNVFSARSCSYERNPSLTQEMKSRSSAIIEPSYQPIPKSVTNFGGVEYSEGTPLQSCPPYGRRWAIHTKSPAAYRGGALKALGFTIRH
jgi:hypothetical protein